MLLMFSSSHTPGEQRNDTRKDSYNFFLSQLRIRIEMTFGMLTAKWQILKRPLQVNIRNAGKVFLTCARLHNFIINERMLATSHPASDSLLSPTDCNGGDSSALANDGQREGTPSHYSSHPFLASDVGISQLRGNSIMRDILVDRIADMALVRPRYNVQRNKWQRVS